MPISFRCSKCNKQYKVSSKLAGKRMLCGGCSSKIRIPNPFARVKDAESDGANPTNPNEPASPQPTIPSGPPQPPAKQIVPMPPSRPQSVQPTLPVVSHQADEEPIELGADDMVVDDFIPIQSEWVVQCDDCLREHRPDESLMGKRIRCKCGTILHLTENTKATLQFAKDEVEREALPELVPVPAKPAGQHFQAPPPSFPTEAAADRHQQERRREAEDMVQQAARRETWERRRAEKQTSLLDDDDEEWGPLGKIIGGGALVAAGIVVALIAYQAGYIVGVSFWLIGIGTLSIIYGLVESLTR